MKWRYSVEFKRKMYGATYPKFWLLFIKADSSEVYLIGLDYVEMTV